MSRDLCVRCKTPAWPFIPHPFLPRARYCEPCYEMQNSPRCHICNSQEKLRACCKCPLHECESCICRFRSLSPETDFRCAVCATTVPSTRGRKKRNGSIRRRASGGYQISYWDQGWKEHYLKPKELINCTRAQVIRTIAHTALELGLTGKTITKNLVRMYDAPDVADAFDALTGPELCVLWGC